MTSDINIGKIKMYLIKHYLDGFYRRKYSLGIYWVNYSGKKIIKIKQKKWWRAIFTNGIIDGINYVGKIRR